MLSARRGRLVVVGAVGQLSLDRTVVKVGAHKVRRLGDGSVLAGFAGGAADAFALLTRFQDKLSEHGGRLERAAVELVRDWRTREPFEVRERVGIRVCAAMARRGVLTRPIGDVIVLMPPFCTTAAQVNRMVRATEEAIREVIGKKHSTR